jgi:hypothetical protein
MDSEGLSRPHCYVHSYFDVSALFPGHFTHMVEIEAVPSRSCTQGDLLANRARGSDCALPS